MLASFKLDNKIYEDNKDKVKRRLGMAGIEGNILDEIANGVNWFSKLDIELLKKISVILNEFNGILNIELVEREDLKYKYDDILKKVFLLELSEKWQSEITTSSAFNALELIEKKEELFDKSVIQFNESEIKQSMVDLFDHTYYFRMRNSMNIFSKFQVFYNKYITMAANWETFKAQKEIENILGQEINETIVTKKDLLNLVSVMPNVQESIIPLLIFEGVSFSKVEEMDELRYLKASDIQGNKIIIRGANARVIDIDNDVAEALEKAINSEYLFKTIQHELRYVELEDAEYILRPSVLARKRKDTSYDKDVMSFRGAYSRFLLCKDFFEATTYDIPFSPKVLESFGKVYHVNKYLGEGTDVYDAIRKTLLRFGDWEGDVEKNKSNPSNVQMVNRMKRIWDLYTS